MAFYYITATMQHDIRHTFDITDLKTQKVGCRDFQPEGCDTGLAVLYHTGYIAGDIQVLYPTS